MRWLKGLVMAVIVIIVALIGILFAVRNQQAVPLDIIWAKLPAASLALWLLISLVIGVVLGMLAMTGMYIRLRTRLAMARRELKQQQKAADQASTKAPAESK